MELSRYEIELINLSLERISQELREIRTWSKQRNRTTLEIEIDLLLYKIKSLTT